jgi:uncharacterized glyoxalase superfamily protein PhnB
MSSMTSMHPARHLLRAKDLADGRYFEPLSVATPPVHDADTAARMNELVAKGAMSGLSFEVDDCRATYAELKGRGVEMIQEPNEVPWAC